MQNKMIGIVLYAGLTTLGLLPGLAAAAETYIVRDGRPQAEIIISPAPARMTRLAAATLQEFVHKMTGANLPITNAPSGTMPVTIYVGKSKYTEDLNLSTNGLAHGAFRMASGPTWLALLGADKDFVPMEPWRHSRADTARSMKEWDAQTEGTYGFPYSQLYRNFFPELDIWTLDDGGTMNAVCEFLRGLGVRWYFPGEMGEVVPRQTDLALPTVDTVVTPDFPMRRFSYWYNTAENVLWNLRMGVNTGHELMGLTQNCHGSKYVYMRDEVKRDHPDWYALWSGKRATDHSYSGAPCFSSEGLFQQHLKFARMIFDVRNEPMLSLDACDGYAKLCLCPLCKDQGTLQRGWSGGMSDYVWGYVNRVAKELYKTHPDRMVNGLSYSAYALPPEKIDKLSPNLALVFCQTRGDFYNRTRRDEFVERRAAWLEKLTSKQMYIYEYYLQNCPRYKRADLPVYFPHQIAEDLRSLKGVSMGDMIEVYLNRDPAKTAANALAVMHLNVYVTTRLWWDADLDLDALLAEYYTLFYGPAAKAMKAFVEYSEAHWPYMSTDVETIDEAQRLLAKARAQAGHTIYGQRIDLIVTYVEPMKERREKLLVYRNDAPEAVAVERRSTELNDAFWSDVPMYELKDLVTGAPPKAKTRFQVAWGDKTIMFRILCDDPDMASLRVSATQNDDPNIFTDDEIELLLETQTHDYYQIAINPAGAMIDLDRNNNGRNTLWASEADVVTFRGDTFWGLEIRFPTADLIQGGIDAARRVEGTKPESTAPWYFNVCRNRPRGKDSELSAFSPTGESRFNRPAKFAKLITP